jgi:hypothetical protein
MTIIFAGAAGLLGLATAIGHSLLSERLILRPLEQDSHVRQLLRRSTRRVMRLVFHLPSAAWAVLGVAVVAARLSGGNGLLSLVAALLFAISGIGNLTALRRLHFGGLMLVAAAGLTAADWAVHR